MSKFFLFSLTLFFFYEINAYAYIDPGIGSIILQALAGAIAAVQGPLGPVAGRISSIGSIIGRVNPLTLVLIGAFTAVGVVLGKLALVCYH